jgi:hypothetical protein
MQDEHVMSHDLAAWLLARANVKVLVQSGVLSDEGTLSYVPPVFSIDLAKHPDGTSEEVVVILPCNYRDECF